jgi:hypothetical protein
MDQPGDSRLLIQSVRETGHHSRRGRREDSISDYYLGRFDTDLFPA